MPHMYIDIFYAISSQRMTQFGSSQYLSTHPSPNPALTLTCYPLTDVRKGRGKDAIAQILTSIPL